MRLHSVLLKNFKSFGGESSIDLKAINYFVGPNGAGKSNILDGLEGISAALIGRKYTPDPGDYYDNDADREMKLGVVVELQTDERLSIIERLKTPPAPSLDPSSAACPFKYLRYEMLFRSPNAASHKISLTYNNSDFHTFISAEYDNNSYMIKNRNIEEIDLESGTLPELRPYKELPSISAAYLLSRIDTLIKSRTIDLFSGLQHAGTDRRIPVSVQIHESHDISPNGHNIPNEINDLSRKDQPRFDKCVAAITGKTVLSVEPRVRGTKLVLEVTEAGRSQRTPREDLSTGQEQAILLAWQLFSRRGTIHILNEPELHLHARAQKEIYRLMKESTDKLQLIVETHSPLFLGTAQHEAVFLVTKDRSGSQITPISPDNMDMIRRELGIAHYDALYHQNILFVEGDSEHIAFPKFISALGYTHAPKTFIFNLGGVGRIKQLRFLLQYFRDDDRRAFVILDGNDTARSLIRALEKEGVIDKNYVILDKDFEDAFDSKTIIEAVSLLAEKFDHKFNLTAAELDRQRGDGKSTATILKKQWKKETDHDLSKADLAKSLADLPSQDIPDEIKRALWDAMAYFSQHDNGG